MWLFGLGVAVLLVGGLLSLLAGERPAIAALVAVPAAIVGSLLALANAVAVLWEAKPVELTLDWPLLWGQARLGLDPLSAVFVFLTSAVVALAALYGVQYLRGSQHAGGRTWFFFNLLAATMLAVVAARNGLLFLLCWEGMSLASCFLVLSEHDRDSVRRAGWIYLVAMHLGTACLLVVFLILGRHSGSLDFDRFTADHASTGALFLLALVGFGTKAGLVPLHVWLPEAHPAAPSHVSAVMSGVMIKTGIYGLLRILSFLGLPPAWWGWTLVGIGVLSGILGVLFALAQRDLKRLLAYSSVENVGVIILGLGVGLLGISYRIPTMAALGLLGGLLHVVHHAWFKSLLFLVAGAVQHATGTRDMDQLGGLAKRMPVTSGAFAIGACAISGLPPLCGFTSELLIYLGALAGAIDPHRPGGVAWALVCMLVIGGLALIGGLAGACFTKAFGCVFLGEPRSQAATNGHDCGAAMRASLVALAGACVIFALAAPLWPLVLRAPLAVVSPDVFDQLSDATARWIYLPLAWLAMASWGLLAGLGLLLLLRARLLGGRPIERGPTWDCGYADPSPRMQYTSSSFASPLVLLFRMFLQPRNRLEMPPEVFPRRARFDSDVPDVFFQGLYQPLFLAVGWVAARLRWLQQGRIQAYVLYIALTILVLMIWKLG